MRLSETSVVSGRRFEFLRRHRAAAEEIFRSPVTGARCGHRTTREERRTGCFVQTRIVYREHRIKKKNKKKIEKQTRKSSWRTRRPANPRRPKPPTAADRALCPRVRTRAEQWRPESSPVHRLLLSFLSIILLSLSSL